MTIMYQSIKNKEMQMEITKKIKEDNDILLTLFGKAFEMTRDDLSVGVCELDIENAFDALSQEDKKMIEKETERRKIYTNIYILYGYEKIYAGSKKEAFEKSVDVNNIIWNKTPMRLKTAPSRYVHEIRFFQNGSKRVTHCYTGNSAMNKEEILSYLNEKFSVDSNSIIEYAFITDGIIRTEFQIRTD